MMPGNHLAWGIRHFKKEKKNNNNKTTIRKKKKNPQNKTQTCQDGDSDSPVKADS